MDVESLAKQLILKNMTPEQQKAVLESIRESVKQSKEVQKQRIGQNVGVVIEALKKIEADIRTKYDELGNAIETRVANIKDGKDGIDGRDGARGLDGRPGRDGQQGPAGAPGKDGRDGVDGVDGVSVTDAKIDFDGSLIISLSNGREINVGEVVAPDVAEKIRVVANGGGTSQSVIDSLASLQQQINDLIPSQTGNAGKFLTTNGTTTSWAELNALTYEGTWNASANTPTLASGVGQNGHYYVVSISGSTNLDGITDWVTGDVAIFNGVAWQKIDQTNLVSSVNGEVGTVVLDAADVGAIASVASADGSVLVATVGTAVDLSVATAGATTNLIAQVRNETGATLTKGTVVYVSGAAGNKALVSKAKADADATSAQTYGVVRADIPNNQNGYIVVVGEVSGIDTTAYAEGAQLYLSGTTAGTYTDTKPYAPIHIVYVAVVTRVHVNQGTLYVKVQNGYEMDELHNVSAQNPTNGQVLIYNESTSLWEKHTITDGTGISITEGAGSITVANTGVLSLTGTADEVEVSASTGAITLSLPSTINANTTGNAATVTNGVYTSGSYSDPSWITALAGSKITGNISGSAANVTGTVAIANGGTGATTAGGALTNLSAAKSGVNTDITSVALTSGTITTVPSSSNDIVNKSYADSIAAGINFHAACNYATTAALAANTYNNGTSGVGATLTGNANNALTVDGATPTVNQRILVKNESTQANNGVYVVTQVGNGSTPYILTRATDFNSAGSGVNQIDAGDFFLVISGTANANTSWVQQTALPITVGTTGIVFTQFGSGSQTYTAGTGLTLSTYQFSITNVGTAGTYGSASSVPVITTNAQGQVTSVTDTAITIAGSAVTGTVAIANGGTGATSRQAAIDALAGATTAGFYLRGDGTDVVMAAIAAGDVPTLNQNTTGSAATFTSTSQNSQFNSIGVGTAGSGTAGEIRATNNITAYFSSDRKLKENIRDIPDALNKVSAIGGKLFDWTDDYIQAHGGEDGYFVQKSDFGVVAQDVQEHFPVAVRTKQDGTLAVDYEKMCALAFAAIAELRVEIEELKRGK